MVVEELKITQDSVKSSLTCQSSEGLGLARISCIDKAAVDLTCSLTIHNYSRLSARPLLSILHPHGLSLHVTFLCGLRIEIISGSLMQHLPTRTSYF